MSEAFGGPKQGSEHVIDAARETHRALAQAVGLFGIAIAICARAGAAEACAVEREVDRTREPQILENLFFHGK